MARTSVSIRINAPRQRVFDVFADLRSAPARIKAIDTLDRSRRGGRWSKCSCSGRMNYYYTASV